MERDWLSIPADLLHKICRKLQVFEDNLGFSSMCSSWRSVAVENRCYLLPQKQCPRLMIEGEKNRFLKLEHDQGVGGPTMPKRQYKHPLHGIPHGYRCCRSSVDGWIILTNRIYFKNLSDIDIHLFNLFSQAKFQLPSLANGLHRGDCYEYFVSWVILSSSPTTITPSDSLVLFVYRGISADYIHQGDRLAFCRPGDKAWTSIGSFHECYEDVVYHNGGFYAFYRGGGFDFYGIIGDNVFKRSTHLASPPVLQIGERIKRKYLVQSASELYLVTNLGHDNVPIFKVFRLREDYKSFDDIMWVQVKSIGDNALFIGPNTSLSRSVSLDMCLGCKRNCIYFIVLSTDYSENVVGLFNLEDHSSELLYLNETIKTASIWVIPSAR